MECGIDWQWYRYCKAVKKELSPKGNTLHRCLVTSDSSGEANISFPSVVASRQLFRKRVIRSPGSIRPDFFLCWWYLWFVAGQTMQPKCVESLNVWDHTYKCPKVSFSEYPDSGLEALEYNHYSLGFPCPTWRWIQDKRDYMSHLASKRPRISPWRNWKKLDTDPAAWNEWISEWAIILLHCTGVVFVSTPRIMRTGLHTAVLHGHKSVNWLVLQAVHCVSQLYGRKIEQWQVATWVVLQKDVPLSPWRLNPWRHFWLTAAPFPLTCTWPSSIICCVTFLT